MTGAQTGLRHRRGARAHLSGGMAEDSVAHHYARTGGQVRARRWRGAAGEIDLIVEMAGIRVFVEVKAAPDHARAALRLDLRQVARICAAAEEYCGMQPGGLSVEMRFDLALVDRQGRVAIIEGAFDDG